MNDEEPSKEELNIFEEAVTRQHLLWLWSLRAKDKPVDSEEIRRIEAEVYPNLQELKSEDEHPLCQRDIDELQLLLSLVEPQGNNNNLFIEKAIVFRLENVTVRMWPENNHSRPHFHIKYRNQLSASYAVDTLERLAGKMPSKYEKPILKWAAQNKESLKITWEKLQAGENIQILISATGMTT
jgi:hypothetical protein